jgi:hypothetical protein
MKSKVEILEFADDFFEGSRLLGIQSDEEAYKICSVLNKKFDYAFKAQTDVLQKKEVFGDNLGLFGNVEARFYVYANVIPPCITTMYLYTNKDREFYLIDQLKKYDYLLLIFNEEMLLYQEDIIQLLATVPCIKKIETLEIESIMEKENLSF